MLNALLNPERVSVILGKPNLERFCGGLPHIRHEFLVDSLAVWRIPDQLVNRWFGKDQAANQLRALQRESQRCECAIRDAYVG